ncbi:MAG: TetR/AcrR family transcriptional regulator [Steroidobacteraceae bacterium]
MTTIADRRLEEKDRRRGDILDAAEAEAARHGIDGLTMERVARRARISRALLYVYFRDRSDLQFGLCGRGLDLLAARFEQAVARQRDGLGRITAIGRAYLAFSQEFPVYFDALARFQAQESTPAEATGCASACLAAGARVHAIMFEAIEAGQRDGSIGTQAGTPVAIAMALWGFMHGIIQLTATKGAVLAGYGLTARALGEQALTLAVRALAPAAGPEPER